MEKETQTQEDVNKQDEGLDSVLEELRQAKERAEAAEAEKSKLAEERDNYKRALKEERERGVEPKVEEEPKNTKELSEAEIQRLIDERVQKAERTRAEDTVKDLLSSIENEKEREAVELIYNSKIQKSGHAREQIQEDLELARQIVRSKTQSKVDNGLATDMSGGGQIPTNTKANSKEDTALEEAPDSVKRLVGGLRKYNEQVQKKTRPAK